MKYISLAVSFVMAAACGGSPGAGTGGAPQCPQAVGDSLSDIQAQIFTISCAVSGCHDSGAVQGLDLSAGRARAALLRTSSEVPSLQLVAPGNPAASYLLDKLQGQNLKPGTQPMPYGSSLCQQKIDAVRQWIAAGAGP